MYLYLYLYLLLMLQHIVECVPSVPFVPGALSFFSSRFLPRPKVILSCHRGVTSWCIYILHISSNLINICVSVSLSWSELSTGIQTPSIAEVKVVQCSLFFSFYVPMFSSHSLVSSKRELQFRTKMPLLVDTNSITDIDTDIKGAFDSSKDKIVEQE